MCLHTAQVCRFVFSVNVIVNRKKWINWNATYFGYNLLASIIEAENITGSSKTLAISKKKGEHFCSGGWYLFFNFFRIRTLILANWNRYGTQDKMSEPQFWQRKKLIRVMKRWHLCEMVLSLCNQITASWTLLSISVFYYFYSCFWWKCFALACITHNITANTWLFRS